MVQHILPEKIFSEAVISNGVAYIAGQVANTETAPFIDQTKETLANLDNALKLCGTDKAKLVSVQIWLSDINDREAFNTVWEQWLNGVNPPARACFQVTLIGDYKIEIMASAEV